MLNASTAAFRTTFPADLARSRGAIADVLSFLRLHGQTDAQLGRWRLPITEAVNNAILHGCRADASAFVSLAACVSADWIEVSVTDPGHYVPSAGVAELGDDLFTESGRGSFLIAQGTDSHEHCNDTQGHTIQLRWRPVAPPKSQLADVATLQAELDGLAIQLGDAYETITAFAELAGVLAKCGDFEEVKREVCARITPTIPHEYCILRLAEGDSLRLADDAPGVPASIPVSSPSSVESRVFASGHTLAFASAGELDAGDPLRSEGGALAVLAVGDARSRRGTLTLTRRAGAEPFTAGQLAFLQAVADILSTARLVNELWARRAAQLRLEQEMQLAARIQQSLLPSADLDLPAWHAAGACRAARQVGGDHHDFLTLADGSCLVLVADVMGKGMPAALVATMLRSSWRALASTSASPGELLAALNRQLWTDLVALEIFITAAIIELRLDGTLRHANAGQGGLLMLRDGEGKARPLLSEGLPLGIAAEASYPTTSLSSGPRDVFFVHTDGCHDFDRTAGTAENLERLSTLLVDAARHGSSARAIVDTALARIVHVSGDELRDDCTLLCLIRRP